MSDLVPAIVAPQPASFNPGASLVELETQLRTAVACADASNKTAAALILHMVEQRKQTVRSIANTVGKSVGWVHGMLVWARSDYVGEPFGGPARKAVRERAVFSQAEQPNKVIVNGQSMDFGKLGPAAQEQIAEAIEAPTQLGADGKTRKKPIHWQQRVHPSVAYPAAAHGVTASTFIEAREQNDPLVVPNPENDDENSCHALVRIKDQTHNQR